MNNCVSIKNMPTLRFITIDNPTLLKCAMTLPNVGVLKYDTSFPYCYLKVHDDFIHKLFPMLSEVEKNNADKENESKIIFQKPDYFSAAASLSGAHISLVYPNEEKSEEVKSDLIKGSIDLTHSFEVISLITAKLYNKTIIVLRVHAPSLVKIREKYGLSEILSYNGWNVPFHITVAVGKQSSALI